MRDKQIAVIWLTGLFVGGFLLLGGLFHPRPTGTLVAPAAIIEPIDLPATATATPIPEQARPVALLPKLATPVSDQLPAAAIVVPAAPPSIAPAAASDSLVGVGEVPGLPSDTNSLPAVDGPTGTATTTPRTVVNRRVGGVPILMYHYIRVNPVASDVAGFNLSVTPDDFASQMAFLADSGYTTVTMAQVTQYVIHGTRLPPKPIAVTFDDGYDDAYTAAKPILDRYGMTATFFIITGFVGRTHYMTWSQIEALDRAGMDVGSHTVHHVALANVGGLQSQYELTQSESDLEAHLGHLVREFCYPDGSVSAAAEIAVRQAGYLSATTTASGFVGVGDDPFRLSRIRVGGGESLTRFAETIGASLNGSTTRLARPGALVPPSIGSIHPITGTSSVTSTVPVSETVPLPPTLHPILPKLPAPSLTATATPTSARH